MHGVDFTEIDFLHNVIDDLRKIRLQCFSSVMLVSVVARRPGITC